MSDKERDPGSRRQPEWEIDLKLFETESIALNPRRLSGTIFHVPPPPEPEPETKPETNSDRNPTRFQSFSCFAEEWLSKHFGRFLGTEGILPKATTFLVTVLIIFFNFLKHRYDLGYYHKALGVPKEYLSAAWNSSMSDFILYALLTILQSILLLALAIGLCLFFVILICIVVSELKALSNKNVTLRRKLLVVCKLVFSSLAIIWLITISFNLPFPRRRMYKWLFLYFLAPLYGAFLMLPANTIIQKAWKNHEAGKKSSVDPKNDAQKTDEGEQKDNSQKSDSDEQNDDTQKNDSNEQNDDSQRNDSNEQNDDSKKKDSPDPDKKTKKSVPIRLIVWIVGLVLAVVLADKLGQLTSSLQTELSFLPASETFNGQMEHLNCHLDAQYWAILYSKDNQYIITPCHIDFQNREAVLYPQYHCVISTEDTVVATKTFDRIHIEGGVLRRDNTLDFTELFFRTSGAALVKDPELPAEPTETISPTEPTATTAPPEPTETPEPTEPPEPTETTEPTEPTFVCPDDCDCCRCIPGLG